MLEKKVRVELDFKIPNSISVRGSVGQM